MATASNHGGAMEMNVGAQARVRIIPRPSPVWAWLILLLLALASIRGMIVVNSDIPAKVVYLTTAAFMLILSVYGYIESNWYAGSGLSFLKALLKLNVLFCIINVGVEMVLGRPFPPSILYVFLAPYILFLFLSIDKRYFYVAIACITLAISYSVCSNFIQSREGQQGYNEVFAYNKKLRPDTFHALSHTGAFFRAAGYTGNPHDSANILGMAVPFYLLMFLIRRRLFYMAMFLLAAVSLTLTQSASNIAVSICTTLMFSGYFFMRRGERAATYVIMFAVLAAVVTSVLLFGDSMSVFVQRFTHADTAGLENQLNLHAFVSAIPFYFVGHGQASGSHMVDIEIALMKLVVQFGIVHAVVLFWILLYPVLLFLKTRCRDLHALPMVAPVFFGFMSLAHYGSLLRETSVFLFYAFYALSLQSIALSPSAFLIHRGVVEKT